MDSQVIMKFCVVGQASVGKTSLLQQYTKKRFSEDTRTTIGCDFITKLQTDPETGKNVRLQVWDIAGQERFNTVSKMYLRGALGCLIVCSAEEKRTLEETLKWKAIVEQKEEEGQVKQQIPCVLVQNKIDLVDPNNPEEFQKKQFLSNFAAKNGFCCAIQTSAKQNILVDDAFQILYHEARARGLVKAATDEAKKRFENIVLGKDESKTPRKKKTKCCTSS